ncbi:hypothetical protein [Micromonospora wenchangensis]|uniref:hypothetical protein n=1 Tax=Micromonospora wenchangensis TaxID=1185415 RepID=UPI003D703DA6
MAFWSRPATIISVFLLVLLMAIVTTWALARSSPATAPGAVGPTSASPTPSSSPSAAPSISVDPSLEPPPTPETPPSGTPTGPGPSAAPTAGNVEPASDPFALSDVAPFSSGSVTLTIGISDQLDLTEWDDIGNDVQFTKTGIVGRNTTQLALLQAGEARSFSTCQAKTAWASALNWSQASPGTFTCIKWGNRRGLMRIDDLSNLDDKYKLPEVTVTGVVWAPAVKG